MNFVSKFDGSLPFTGTYPKAQTHVDTVQTKAPADAIVVKDANLLFNGDFKRSGTDLVISKDDQDLVLSDYFKGEKRAPVASPDGAWLSGKIIEALTGHVQFAQADGSASVAPKIIGHVTKLSGNATVIRNGVSVILNNGDNVHQGDIVQSGSNSSVGITFVDGSVFGLASNARMVLNEMVYDPNGSNNSSFLSLVQGTISFVAGATAKHGDMKVDTPVATMGIRGTAVVVEIDFEVTVPGSAPPARFQVVVEPDGTVGSLVLLDRLTLAPIATVNQAGTVTTVSGQGAVSFLSSAQLSPEVMKLISEVFSQKFTDNSNPRSDTHFTDTVIPDNSFPVRFANGDTGTATVRVFSGSEAAQGSNTPAPKSNDHIPGAPGIFIVNKAFAEFIGLTGRPDPNGVQGAVVYTDLNPGDQPTVSTAFNHYGYKSATGQDVTSSLTATQRSAIDAVSVPLHVAQDPDLKNNGTATWTYTVPDQNLDFLADGEKLTLTYVARVDNNFAGANEFSLAPFTITITGKNDTPTIASAPQIVSIKEIDDPDSHDSVTPDTVTGKIEFRDVDLTDTHSVAITGVTGSGTMTGLQGAGGTSGTSTIPISDTSVLHWLSLSAPFDSTDGVTGSRIWTFSAQDHYFDYLAETESVTLTYTVEVDDHHGGTVTQNVVVTVNGSNDAPELAADVSGTDDAGLHPILEKEHATNSSITDHAEGSLTFRDLDLSDTHTFDPSGPTFAWYASSHATLTLTQDLLDALTAASNFSLTPTDSTGTGLGSIAFSYSATDHYFDFLAEGETLTITYDVTVADHYTSDTQSVTFTVTGSNDAPVAVADVVPLGVIIEAGVDAHNLPVDSNAVATGNVLTNDTDVDITDSHAVIGVAAGATGALSGNVGVGATVTGKYGSLVLQADGSWKYTLDDTDPDTNALPQGAHVTDVFTYTQSDGHGGTSTTTLTVNITGTNDTPVANAEPVAVDDHGAPVSEQGVNPGNDAFPGVSLVSGNVLTNDTDVDTGDTKTVQGAAFGDATSGPPLTGLVAPQVVHGAYGDLTIAADGSWSYQLDNAKAATQALTQGDHRTEIFTYTMHDTVGSPSSAKLTIDVYGTNDAPTVAAPLTYGTDEGNASFTRDLLYGANDVDSGETATLSVVNVTYKVDGVTSAAAPAGFSVSGSTLSVDPTNSAYDHLAVGASTTIEVSYSVKDAHDATVTQTETITIHGTNDVPTVTGALTANANEGDAPFTKNLLQGASDLDDGETATLSVVNVTYKVDTGLPSSTAPAGVSLSGNTLNVDPTNAAFNHLAVGAHTTITIAYDVKDAQDATVPQTETITIYGTNDIPTVAGALTATANEGDASFTKNLLQDASDLDDGETASLSVVNVTYKVDSGPSSVTAPAGISISGSTLTVDPTNAAFDHLAVGEHLTITVSYNVKDAQGATVPQTETITIYGTEDYPTVMAALSATANEGDLSFTQNMLLGASDLDDGETASLQITGMTFKVDSGTPSTAPPAGVTFTGNTLAVNPSAPAFDYLAVGTHTTITESFNVTDAQGVSVPQVDIVTINGTNDPASIVGEANPPTHGVMVVNPVSPSIEPAGVNTNSLGLSTETFDNVSAGVGSFTSSTLGATFTRSGSAGVVHGSSSSSAAPFMGPGVADPTNYLTIGGGASETIQFTSSKNTFGLYWGSVDTYNSIKFYDGSTLVASYTGADVAPLLANGNQGSFTANGYVEFVGLHNFNKVVLSSSSNAFEIDNISAGNVPASHSLLTGTVSGTMSVHDPDIGDTLTGVVSANATALLNGSSTLPNGVNVADLIKASNISFDSVQSDGGTDVLHWNYDPHGANLDFLHAGDTLKLTYAAKVSDGHDVYGSQSLTITLVGTDNDTNVSAFKFVDGTSGNDTFSNVGNGTTLVGNGGHDNFVFKPNSGSATITDFDPANDVITFDSSMFGHNPANVLLAAHEDHGNTVIPLNGTNTLTLLHVLPGALNSSDFHFV